MQKDERYTHKKKVEHAQINQKAKGSCSKTDF